MTMFNTFNCVEDVFWVHLRQLFNICFLTQEDNTIFKLYFNSVGKLFGKIVLYEALRQTTTTWRS